MSTKASMDGRSETKSCYCSKAELWQCLTCSRIPRLAGGNPSCNDTLQLRYNKQQFRATHRGTEELDKLLGLFPTVCTSLGVAQLIARVCVSRDILNKSEELKKQNRVCGSGALVWADATSAAFSGAIFFGLTGGRARFCSCSSFLWISS